VRLCSVLLTLSCTLTTGYSELFSDNSDKRQDLVPFPRVGRAIFKRQGLIPFPRIGRSAGFVDVGENLDDGDDNWESPFDLSFFIVPYKKRQHSNGFTPRIGKRRRRSVSPEDESSSTNDDREVNSKKTVSWHDYFSPQSLMFERALRQLIPSPRIGRGAFVPRIGKKSVTDTDEVKRGAFSPRIGRASFTPRIGRASFTPRIGRSSPSTSGGATGCKTDV